MAGECLELDSNGQLIGSSKVGGYAGITLVDGYDQALFGVTTYFEVYARTDSSGDEWIKHSNDESSMDDKQLECVTKFDDDNLIAIGFAYDQATEQKQHSLNYYNIQSREWTFGNFLNFDEFSGHVLHQCFMLNDVDLVFIASLGFQM